MGSAAKSLECVAGDRLSRLFKAFSTSDANNPHAKQNILVLVIDQNLFITAVRTIFHTNVPEFHRGKESGRADSAV